MSQTETVKPDGNKLKCEGCNRTVEHLSAVLPFSILEKMTDTPLKIRGVAMTAGMSRNFNIYTPEELNAFSSKLVDAPVYIEHVSVDNAVGKVTKTDWDGHNLLYEAEIYDGETADKIRKGLIQHVSVGADYEAVDLVDGKIPHGLHNAELSLVAVPGIPETNVQVLEKLVDTKVTEALRKAGVQEAEWDAAYVSDLPDDCFAAIELGGSRDDQGKTTPRSLRHLEYKNAEGKLDQAHVVAALQRLDQTKISSELKAQALKKLCSAAGELKIESAVCSLQGTSEGLQSKLTENEGKLIDVTSKLKYAQKTIEDLRKQVPGGGLLKNPPKMIAVSEAAMMVEAVLPSPMIQRSWSLGPQRMCQELRRVVKQLEQKAVGG
jgi:hypothetical protein